ncbi:MAG: Type I signal peptidase, partial [Candidatus Roizmanbacteria bacterium GW2011_GWB1_40_7]
MKKIKNILKYASIALVVVFGATLFMLSRQVAGYRAFVVMSASMEPLIRTGSLIITQRVNPHTLKENDVVTFIRPDNTKEFITHRIVSVSKPDSIPLFKTKGDNNESADTWTLVGGGVVGKVHYTIPHLGYLLSLARTKIGIAVLILLPAFFIILDEAKIIMGLIKKRRQQSEKKLSPTAISLFFIGIAVYSFNAPSQAILSDSVSLVDNTF